jgi:hypothetical protein
MLCCWLMQNRPPTVVQCITHFGRQCDGVFISSNLAFKGRFLAQVESSPWSIAPHYFRENESLPMSPEVNPPPPPRQVS